MAPKASRDHSPTPAEKMPRRWTKRLALSSGMFLLGLGLVALMLPTLADREPVKGWLLGKVNNRIAGSVAIDELELGWSEGQRISGLTLFDAQGQPAMTVAAIDAPGVGLWSVLRGHRHFGTIRIDKPAGNIDGLHGVFADDNITEQGSTGAPSSTTPTEDDRVQPPFSVKIEVADAKLSYGHQGAQPLELEIPTATFDVLNPRHIRIIVNGMVHRTGGGERIDADVTINDLFDNAGQLTVNTVKIDGRAEATEVPTTLLDAILGQNKLAQGLLGEGLTVQLNAKGEVNSRLDATFALRSERFRAEGELISRQGTMSLAPGTRCTLRVDQTSWQALAQRIAALDGTRLVKPFEIQASLAELTIPTGDTGLKTDRIKIDGTLSASDVECNTASGRWVLSKPMFNLNSKALGAQIDGMLTAEAELDGHRGAFQLTTTVRRAFDHAGRFDRQKLQALIDAKLRGWPTAVVDRLIGTSLGAQALGPRVDIDLSTKLDPFTNPPPPAPYTLAIKSGHLASQLTGTLDLHRLECIADGVIHITVTPQWANGLAQRDRSARPDWMELIRLAKPAKLVVNLDDLAVRWRGSKPDLMSGGIVIEVDRLIPLAVPLLTNPIFSNLKLAIPDVSPSKTVAFTLDGACTDGPDSAGWHLAGSARDLWQSPTHWRLDNTSFAELALSPDTFSAWTAKPGGLSWMMGHPARFHLKFKQARLAIQKDASGQRRLDPINSALDLRLTVSDVTVDRRGSQQPTTFETLTMTARAEDLSKPIRLAIRTPTPPEAAAAAEQMAIESINMIAGLFGIRGDVDLARAKIQTRTEARLPVDLIDRLLHQQGQLTGVLGQNAHVRLQGGFDLDRGSNLNLTLHAPNARAELAGRIGQTVELTKTGSMELTVTPALSTILLRKINPIINAVSSDRPIQLTIPPNGFSAPVRDFDFSQVTGDLELNLGTLTLDRTQALGLIVDLLAKHAGFGSSGLSQRYVAKFTPTKIHLENGVVSYRDMGVDIDGVVLTFRGSVDIPNDHVNLTIGLSGQTFAANENIGRYLRPEDTFEVAMTGPTDRVTFDSDRLIRSLLQTAGRRGLSELAGRQGAPFLDLFLGGIESKPNASADTNKSGAAKADRPANAPKAQSPPNPLQILLSELQRRDEQKKRKKKEKKRQKKNKAKKKKRENKKTESHPEDK